MTKKILREFGAPLSLLYQLIEKGRGLFHSMVKLGKNLIDFYFNNLVYLIVGEGHFSNSGFLGHFRVIFENSNSNDFRQV